LRYQDTLKSDLSVKGKTFRSGDKASLDYQFPTVRLSANKPIFQSDDGSYIFAGGSAVVRYAKVGLSGGGQSFSDTNLILVALINIEASKPVGSGYSLFTRQLTVSQVFVLNSNGLMFESPTPPKTRGQKTERVINE